MNNFRKFLLAFFFCFAIFQSYASETRCVTSNKIIIRMDRGVEIRYIKMKVEKNKEAPKEIILGGTSYPLFKTKEDAYNTVLNSSVKKDITIVYVISNEEKNTETLPLKK